MQKIKSVLVWVLFALCLVAAFGFGYFVRGTADDGESRAASATTTQTDTTLQESTHTEKPKQTTSAVSATLQTIPNIFTTYILNTDSKKIHYSTCIYAKKIAEKNKDEYTGYYTDLLEKGYTVCGTCFKK